MKRRHAFVISTFLALALVAGAFAALRTAQLGARTTSVPAAQIEAKNRLLDRYAAALRREAQKRPPVLPAIPAATAPRRPAAQAPQLIYRRPPAIVRIAHRRYENEHEGEQFDD